MCLQLALHLFMPQQIYYCSEEEKNIQTVTEQSPVVQLKYPVTCFFLFFIFYMLLFD